MADVADLFLPPLINPESDLEILDDAPVFLEPPTNRHGHRFMPEDDEEEEDDQRETDPDMFVPVFTPDFGDLSFGGRSPSVSDDDEEGDISIGLDLLDRCSQPPRFGEEDVVRVDSAREALQGAAFSVFDGAAEVGLGFVVDKDEFCDACGRDEGVFLGEETEEGLDWDGDGFFVSRGGSSLAEDGGRGSSVAGGGGGDGLGLRIARFESESESGGEQIGANSDDGASGDLGGLPMCWDCLGVEDRRDLVEEFEWEEVDGRVDEREDLGMVIDAMEDRSNLEEIGEHAASDSEEETEAGRSLEWEVLLTLRNMPRDPSLEHEDAESYMGDESDYVYTSEYEVLFGQFTDHDNSIRGSPPASKSVVESLPSIAMTQEDAAKNNTLCAVCKDEISLEELAKQLPCKHHYHGDCILPWLAIRNTCPVCRYELPTDDREYESSKAQRDDAGWLWEESPVRYAIEMLLED